jgi:hypothetical protein
MGKNIYYFPKRNNSKNNENAMKAYCTQNTDRECREEDCCMRDNKLAEALAFLRNSPAPPCELDMLSLKEIKNERTQ